jgi:hypothetical protein
LRFRYGELRIHDRFGLATVIVHLVYFLLLQRGYREGDLSLI